MKRLIQTVASARLALITVIAIGASAALLQAQDDPTPKSPAANAALPTDPAAQDAMFITNAAMANLTEIEITKLGTQKAENSDLKTLSEHLRKDHAAANEKLQPIAQKKGLTFPESLDSRHQQAVDKLSQLSGAEFDKALATDLLRSHARSVAMYQRELRITQDADIKEYVSSTLPVIKQHLQSIQKAAKDVGVDDQIISSLTRERPAAGGTGAGSETETGGEKKSKSSDDSNK